jgi:hypothetical protein
MRFFIAEGGISFTNTLGQLTTLTRGQILDTAAYSIPAGWTIPPDSGAFWPMDSQAQAALRSSIAAQRQKTGNGPPPPGIISLGDPTIFAP